MGGFGIVFGARKQTLALTSTAKNGQNIHRGDFDGVLTIDMLCSAKGDQGHQAIPRDYPAERC